MKTYSITKLYHKFLQPNDISIEHLDAFFKVMVKEGFIVPVDTAGNGPSLDERSRYIETDKLSGGTDKDGLFKLVQGLI